MGVQYATRAQATTLLKDKKQHLAVSVFATNRLSMLAEQLSSCVPTLKNTLVVWIPFSLGLIVSCLANPAEKYLERENKALVLSALCKLTVGVGKACEFSLKYSHILIDVACLVSYVALILLGFPVTGAIGLAGLVLIAVKRAGIMPPLLDKIMEPLSVLATLAAGFLIPTHFFLRGIQIFFSLNYFLLHALKNCHPLPGKHIDKGIKPESKHIFDNHVDKLKVNLTSIFTKDLYCLPQSKKNSDVLFKEIEERIKKENIRFDLEIIASWIKEKSRVLDIGCGEGDLLQHLKNTKQIHSNQNKQKAQHQDNPRILQLKTPSDPSAGCA